MAKDKKETNDALRRYIAALLSARAASGRPAMPYPELREAVMADLSETLNGLWLRGEITAHLDKNGVRVVTWKGADGSSHIAKQSNNCNKLQNSSL